VTILHFLYLYIAFELRQFLTTSNNLFGRFSVTHRSDYETSSKLVQHLFNFKCLSDQLVSAAILLLSIPRVAAMLPWKHARFQDGVNETLIDIIKVPSLFSTYCAH
jgi:hypothetical protein